MKLDSRQLKVVEWAKAYFKENKPSPKNKQDALHDIDHALRVAYWATVLAEKEGGDLNILIPAAILHDIAIPKVGDDTHAREGAVTCKPVLKACGYFGPEIEEISGIIATHSTDDENPPKSLQGRILFDADKLDATGPISLHRFFFEFQKRGFLHEPALGKTLAHIENWKKRYGKEVFFTKTARKISKSRLDYIIKTCKEILDDAKQFKEFTDLG